MCGGFGCEAEARDRGKAFGEAVVNGVQSGVRNGVVDGVEEGVRLAGCATTVGQLAARVSWSPQLYVAPISGLPASHRVAEAGMPGSFAIEHRPSLPKDSFPQP